MRTWPLWCYALATHCAVLRYGMLLHKSYAVCGTELRKCYGLCGTEVGYGATRRGQRRCYWRNASLRQRCSA
eukprot:1354476-Rhodomonas_salina.1